MQRVAHKPQPLRINSFWMICGTLSHIVSHAGVLIILAKLTDVTTLGKFAYAIAIVEPVVQITGLNLRALHATDSKIETAFPDVFGLRILTSIAALILICSIATVVSSSPSTKIVIILVGISRILESLSDILYASLQRREIMAGIGCSRLIRGTLTIPLLLAAIMLTGSLIAGIGALIAARALTLCAYDLPHVKRVAALDTPDTGSSKPAAEFTPQFDRLRLTRLLSLTLPLGITFFVIGLNINIPRYVLNSMGGEAALGVFAALAYVQTAVRQFAEALGQAAMPRMARFYGAGDLSAYKALLGKLLLIGSIIGLGCIAVAMLLGSELLTIMYNKTYGAQQSAFVVIMIGGLFLLTSTFMNNAITAARAFRIQIPFLAAATVVVSVTAGFLISRLGVDGAAWTLVILGIFQVLFRAGIIFWLLHQGSRQRD